MGQKVHPLIQRIGFIKNWNALWFAEKKEFADYLQQDVRIRSHIKKRFSTASISKVVIERLTNRIRIKIFSARPGVIIGRHGQDIERLKQELQDIAKQELSIDIVEITNPALEAQIVAANIAFQLEKRIAFRRAMKRAIEQSINAGAGGIKISCAGRLGGAEMSRRETYKQGKVPLQTLRADIDYGFTEALTTCGLIGIKVWIYRGEILPEVKQRPDTKNPKV